jgi:hypothetical protein
MKMSIQIAMWVMGSQKLATKVNARIQVVVCKLLEIVLAI